jgi:predicted transcriptional regulator
MIENTIGEIEAKIRATGSVGAAQKQELLALLATLKTEVADLSRTHQEQADSIAEFARLSARESTRANPDPKLKELSLQGLNSSTEGFQQSHPRLVQIVNNITKTLSDLGI